MTFLVDNSHENLKWNAFVDKQIKLPTPRSLWKPSPPVYGAYKGGYADSVSTKGQSHKPGLSCIMENKAHFCAICVQGMNHVIQYGLGL